MRGRRNWSQLLDYDNCYCLGEETVESWSLIRAAPFGWLLSVCQQMGLAESILSGLLTSAWPLVDSMISGRVTGFSSCSLLPTRGLVLKDLSPKREKAFLKFIPSSSQWHKWEMRCHIFPTGIFIAFIVCLSNNLWEIPPGSLAGQSVIPCLFSFAERAKMVLEVKALGWEQGDGRSNFRASSKP